MPPPLLQSSLPFPVRRGKVRDVYDLGHSLLIVATDRISAFDVVMPNGIPDKGKILTALSLFWFSKFAPKGSGVRGQGSGQNATLNPEPRTLNPIDGFENHLIATDVSQYPEKVHPYREQLEGRSMLVKKAKVLPIECVARGYLAGSGWKEYQKTQSVCGVNLPPGLRLCDKLPTPIFTPATKEESGHDINISFEETAKRVGHDLATQLKDRTLRLYTLAADYAASRGILIADTKFEFGIVEGSGFRGQGSGSQTQTGHADTASPPAIANRKSQIANAPNPRLILIDEVLTPDSSRFWPADQYAPGRDQPSFDKQFVRNYLESQPWDKTPPAPTLPADVVQGTRQRYVDAYEKLTGLRF